MFFLDILPTKNKPMNPIYLDSDTDEEPEEEDKNLHNGLQKTKELPATIKDHKTNAIIKKYLYEDVNKSPLAPVKTKSNALSDITDKPSTSLAAANAQKTPNKINFEDIENSYQLSMKSLNESIEKMAKDRNKFTLTPIKTSSSTTSTTSNKSVKTLDLSPKQEPNTSILNDSFDDLVNQTNRFKKDKESSVLGNKTEVDCAKLKSNSLDIKLENVKEIKENLNKECNNMEDKKQDIIVEKTEELKKDSLSSAAKTDKPKINIVFEFGLNDYLSDLIQNHHFKTGANEVSLINIICKIRSVLRIN